MQTPDSTGQNQNPLTPPPLPASPPPLPGSPPPLPASQPSFSSPPPIPNTQQHNATQPLAAPQPRQSYPRQDPGIDLIPSWKFVLLTIATCGLYLNWWSYKIWKFFNEKESLGISPAVRAIFAIIFTIPLLLKIRSYATYNGHTKAASLPAMYIPFLATSFLFFLPPPLFLLCLLRTFTFIPAVNVFNFALTHDEKYSVIPRSFNTRQIWLLVLGAIFWSTLIAGLIMGPTPK